MLDVNSEKSRCGKAVWDTLNQSVDMRKQLAGGQKVMPSELVDGGRDGPRTARRAFPCHRQVPSSRFPRPEQAKPVILTFEEARSSPRCEVFSLSSEKARPR